MHRVVGAGESLCGVCFIIGGVKCCSAGAATCGPCLGAALICSGTQSFHQPRTISHMNTTPADYAPAQPQAAVYYVPRELAPIYTQDMKADTWCDELPSTIIVSNPDLCAEDCVAIAFESCSDDIAKEFDTEQS